MTAGSRIKMAQTCFSPRHILHVHIAEGHIGNGFFRHFPIGLVHWQFSGMAKLPVSFDLDGLIVIGQQFSLDGLPALHAVP